MSQELTTDWILDRCKEVSFKKGTSFVAKKKVSIVEIGSKDCIGLVDEEKVEVRNYQDTKLIQCQCTCPRLASIPFYCQHVAALLITLQQIKETSLVSLEEFPLQKEREPFEYRSPLPVTLILSWDGGWQPPYIEFNSEKFSLDISDWSTNINWNKFYIDKYLYELIERIKTDKQWVGQLQKICTNLKDTQYSVTINGKQVFYQEVLKDKIPLSIDYVSQQILLTYESNNYLILADEKTIIVNNQLIFLSTLTFSFVQQLLLKKRLMIEGIDWPYIKKEIFSKVNHIFQFHYLAGYLQWENKKPLQVHLYLDRFKNQLLVSLDFVYDQITFNPFTAQEKLNIARNEEMEDIYLQYLLSFGLEEVEEGFVLMDEEKEFEFLQNGLKMLPVKTKIFATTAVRNRIVPANKFPKINVHVKKERTDWLQFSFDTWQLSKEEIIGLMEAIRVNKKYYPLKNGSLFSLDLKEKEQIQRFLNGILIDDEFDPHHIEVPLRASLPYIFGSSFKHTQSFEQWKSDFKKMKTVTTFLDSITLKDYQVEGIQWMQFMNQLGFGGVLADDMGLGKTIQAIGYLKQQNNEKKTLIIAPSSVIYQWKEEFNKLVPDKNILVLDGTINERKTKQNNWSNEIIITSYSLIKKDLVFYEKYEWDTIIYDEAQYFKNPLTQLFKSLKKIKGQQKFALTGTPIENNLVELWSIYHIIMPELFGQLDEFRFIPKITISKMLSFFLLRRTKNKLELDLPEKHHHIVEVELNARERHYYAAYLAKLKEETFKKLNEEVSPQQQKIIFLAALTRLRQICCHLQLIDRKESDQSSKLDALMKILRDAKRQNKKVLVFSQFTSMLSIISQQLVREEITFSYLDGATKKQQRTQLVDQFNKSDIDVFLISLKAGGVGLNLTGASMVVMYDSWWNPMTERQAEDRAYRIGQTEDVHIIKLIAKGTIEQKLLDLQQQKRELVEEIFTSHKNPLLSPTVEQLKWLVDEV